ncbi:DedA family protein [Brevibacillus dissolubilis]|uniref:DedA family protein n=1 Tax=Brevibacillus dissolubilis TaxID=1844116 RepID=UPI003F658C1B
MNLDLLVSVVEQYGYAALFFLLWLGIVGLPIPDELVVATGGFVASLGILDPYYAFLFDYLGVVSGLSIGYFLGRWIGPPIITRLMKKKKLAPYIHRSTELINKYGAFSLCISYALPVVRHVVPYIVAVGGMSYRKYALFSYTTGLVWTFAFYMVGYLFGQHMEKIIEMTRTYGFILLGVLVVLLLLFFLYRWLGPNRFKQAGGRE